MSSKPHVDDGFATVLAVSGNGTAVREADEMETRLFGDGVTYGSIPSFVQASAERQHVVPTTTEENPIPDDPAFRYEDLGLIGRGMMGEVRRVRDRDLNRTVAMKVVRSSLTNNRRLLARFIAEAQAAAQLNHPSIIPIHELGVLPDRRFFFTMKEVRGETLRDVIRAFHDGDSRFTLSAVVGLFRKAAEAVAYAHSRGVLHRDLKPDNVMVGSFGEVLVLDWGLAKVLEDDGVDPDLERIVTNRSIDAGLKTQLGTVAGTPCYMPPEQAAGQFSDVGPQADVYALGAMLYEVVLGRPPYSPNEAREVLKSAISGTAAQDLSAGKPMPSIPSGLARIADRALRAMADERYPSAGEFIAELGEWLDGERVRDRARAAVERAGELFATADAARIRLQQLAHERTALLRASGCEHTDRLNALSDEMDELSATLGVVEQDAVAQVRGALAQASDLDEGHRALARFYRQAHERAARRHDPRAEQLLAHLDTHDRGEQTGYRNGTGYLALRCDPAPSSVFAAPMDLDSRDGTVGEEQLLGYGNQLAVELSAGSWRLRVESANGSLIIPARVDRLGFWDARGPNGETHVIPLDVDTRGGIYVPAGWYRAGADAGTGAGTRDVWVDGFVAAADVVTNEQYAMFLSSLVRDGEEMLAIRMAGDLCRGARSVLKRTTDGFVPTSADRDDAPISGIPYTAAVAYASWVAERTGQPWRLPREHEWEKAARGVDGRAFPWGRLAGWGLAATAEVAHEPVPVDAFPADESPYGIRGCAGNVSEWCAEVWVSEEVASVGLSARSGIAGPERRVVRGGCFRDEARDARVGARRALRADQSDVAVGFRLVRSIDNGLTSHSR